MEDKPHIPAFMNSLPENKSHWQPSSALSGPGQGVDGAEASSRAMYEVRRSILRKLAPCFHKANPLPSHTGRSQFCQGKPPWRKPGRQNMCCPGHEQHKHQSITVMPVIEKKVQIRKPKVQPGFSPKPVRGRGKFLPLDQTSPSPSPSDSPNPVTPEPGE